MNQHRISLIFIFTLATGLVWQNAYAADTHFRITNNSGAARSDLHMEFSGTGGTATLVVRVNPLNCPLPTVSNPGTPWDIDWGVACVDPGEAVSVTITSDFAGVLFSSGQWTPGDVALAPEDVVELPFIPTLPQWGPIVFIGFVILAVWYMRRSMGMRAKGASRPAGAS